MSAKENPSKGKTSFCPQTLVFWWVKMEVKSIEYNMARREIPMLYCILSSPPAKLYESCFSISPLYISSALSRLCLHSVTDTKDMEVIHGWKSREESLLSIHSRALEKRGQEEQAHGDRGLGREQALNLGKIRSGALSPPLVVNSILPTLFSTPPLHFLKGEEIIPVISLIR